MRWAGNPEGYIVYCQSLNLSSASEIVYIRHDAPTCTLDPRYIVQNDDLRSGLTALARTFTNLAFVVSRGHYRCHTKPQGELIGTHVF